MRSILLALVAICVIAIGVPALAADTAPEIQINDFDTPVIFTATTQVASEVAADCASGTCVLRERHRVQPLRTTIRAVRHVAHHVKERRFFARRCSGRLCLRR